MEVRNIFPGYIVTRLLKVPQGLSVSEPLESWGYCLARNIDSANSCVAYSFRAFHAFLEPTCKCRAKLWDPWRGKAGITGEGLALCSSAGKDLCPHAQGTCPWKKAAHSVTDGDKYALKISSLFPMNFNLRVTWEHRYTKARQVEGEHPTSPVCKQVLCRMPSLQQLRGPSHWKIGDHITPCISGFPLPNSPPPIWLKQYKNIMKETKRIM